MPRYFFHIDYGELSRDDEGVELPSLAAARAAGVTLLGEILRDERDAFWTKPTLVITVADDRNLTLWQLTVSGQEAPSVSQALRPFR